MIPEPVARCRVRHDGLLCFQWADVLNGTYLYTGIYTGVERSSLNRGYTGSHRQLASNCGKWRLWAMCGAHLF